MRTTVKNEQGASLVLVIAFVMIFALILGAIIEFAGTGFRTSRAIASERAEQMALDAAIDGAINAIRGSDSSGAIAGQPCTTNTFNYDGDAGVFTYGSGVERDPDVTVTCTTEVSPNSGLASTLPEYAVLTLSQDECEGFLLTGTTPHPDNRLTIRGGIFSNGRIAIGETDQNPDCSSPPDIDADRITVVGDVWSQRYVDGSDQAGCTPFDEADNRPTHIGFTGRINCKLTTTEADPGYLPAVPNITGMTIDPDASCANANSIVVFPPGVYTESPIEHAARANCDNNGNSVWWFQPGVHYFDFPEASSLWDLTANGGIAVVAGTLRTGLSDTSASSSATFPGVCVTANGAGVEQPGAQLIFGGTSRIKTLSSNAVGDDKGDMEVCGSTIAKVPGSSQPTETQRIALYGLRSGLGTRTSTNSEREAVAPVSDPGNDWTGDDDAIALEGNLATTTLTGGSNEEASLEFSGFNIPEGSLVTDVRVKARHRELGSSATKVDPKLFIEVAGGSPVSVGSLSNRNTFETVSTLRSSTDNNEYPEISGSLKQAFRYEDVNDLVVTFQADGNRLTCPGNPNNCTADTATVELDALVLDVTYTPPGFTPQTCPVSEPECIFLTTTNNPRVIFQGTVYTPLARYDVSMQNGTDQLFSRGIIAWDIAVRLNASSNQTVSPFQLPGFTQRRRVLFEASIGNTDDCSPDGDRCRLRVRVEYTDDQSTTGREVEILDWSVVQ